MLNKKIKIVTMTEQLDGSRTIEREYNNVEVFEGENSIEIRIVTGKWYKGMDKAMIEGSPFNP